MVTSSITSALGAGSGIDIAGLVTSLVDNQFSIKTRQLQARTDAIAAQISGVGSVKSAISGFSSALTSLVRGGSLATAPTSSNVSVLDATTLPGATIGQLAASLEVRQLARPQSAATGVIADPTAAIGTGSFTLTFGEATVANGAMTGFTAGPGTPVTIAIGPADASLDGIARAINAAAAGISASVVSDGGGARLILKGATGASQAFKLHSGNAGLATLNVEPGATRTSIGSAAQDAIVALDGVAIRRSSNTISNLVTGVKLELTATGTTTLGTTRPTTALTQAATDFVETYNELFAVLKAQTDPVGGPLRADPAAQALQRALARLPLTTLVNSTDPAAPRTLAEIGVGTNRDGTLKLDTARLATALAGNPAGVEALFADGSGASGGGIAAALAAIATDATSRTAGLGASETRYTAAKTRLADDSTAATEAAEKLRIRLTSQFASMDSRVAAYKSTQTFLKNQIDAWNSSND